MPKRADDEWGGLDDVLSEATRKAARDESDKPLRDKAREQGEATPNTGATPQNLSNNDTIRLTLAASSFRGKVVTVTKFADEAECTNQRAREHLDHLCNIGLAEQKTVAAYKLYEVGD